MVPKGVEEKEDVISRKDDGQLDKTTAPYMQLLWEWEKVSKL